MPNPRFLRVRLAGVFGTTDQTWSVGLNYGPPGTSGLPAGSVTQDELAAASAAIRALNANEVIPLDIRALMAGRARITAIRCSVVGEDGREELIGLTEPASAVGGSGTVKLPQEVAVVASLRTDLPGRRRRGRIYWPAQGAPIDADGRIPTSASSVYATETAEFIQDVRQALATATGAIQIVPIVVSTTGNFATEVTAVSVGNSFDIQRRRGNQEREVYSVAPVSN